MIICIPVTYVVTRLYRSNNKPYDFHLHIIGTNCIYKLEKSFLSLKIISAESFLMDKTVSCCCCCLRCLRYFVSNTISFSLHNH